MARNGGASLLNWVCGGARNDFSGWHEYEKTFGFTLAPGQAHELPLAPIMLDNLPAIPTKRRYGAVTYPKWDNRCRHLVENLCARLKEWRAVATRYEKNSNIVPRGHTHRCRSRLDQALTGTRLCYGQTERKR